MTKGSHSLILQHETCEPDVPLESQPYPTKLKPLKEGSNPIPQCHNLQSAPGPKIWKVMPIYNASYAVTVARSARTLSFINHARAFKTTSFLMCAKTGSTVTKNAADRAEDRHSRSDVHMRLYGSGCSASSEHLIREKRSLAFKNLETAGRK